MEQAIAARESCLQIVRMAHSRKHHWLAKASKPNSNPNIALTLNLTLILTLICTLVLTLTPLLTNNYKLLSSLTSPSVV